MAQQFTPQLVVSAEEIAERASKYDELSMKAELAFQQHVEAEQDRRLRHRCNQRLRRQDWQAWQTMRWMLKAKLMPSRRAALRSHREFTIKETEQPSVPLPGILEG